MNPEGDEEEKKLLPGNAGRGDVTRFSKGRKSFEKKSNQKFAGAYFLAATEFSLFSVTEREKHDVFVPLKRLCSQKLQRRILGESRSGFDVHTRRPLAVNRGASFYDAKCRVTSSNSVTIRVDFSLCSTDITADPWAHHESESDAT